MEQCATEENLHIHYRASQDVNFPKMHLTLQLFILAGENEYESGFSVSCSSEINLLINSNPSGMTFS